MSKSSNFTTHHLQLDAQSQPGVTQVTETNSTVLGGYRVTKHSLGTHANSNTTNNYYVNLVVGGLSSWRHIHGHARFSNYNTGGGQTYEFSYCTTNASSSIYTAKDIATTPFSSSHETIMTTYLGTDMLASTASTTTTFQFSFRNGRNHPMCWFDFTVASGSYSNCPDIGDISIVFTNTRL